MPQSARGGVPLAGAGQAVDFNWLQGVDLVTFYESSPGASRGFCGVCGSPVQNRVETTEISGGFNPAGEKSMVGVQLGGLDDDPGVAPGLHIFVASKSPWLTITDELPQFEALPPRRCSPCSSHSKTKRTCCQLGGTSTEVAHPSTSGFWLRLKVG